MSKKSGPNFQEIVGKKRGFRLPLWGGWGGYPPDTMDSQEKTNILAPELLSMHFACVWSRFGSPCLHLQYFDKFLARNLNADLSRGTVKPQVEL